MKKNYKNINCNFDVDSNILILNIVANFDIHWDNYKTVNGYLKLLSCNVETIEGGLASDIL